MCKHLSIEAALILQSLLLRIVRWVLQSSAQVGAGLITPHC